MNLPIKDPHLDILFSFCFAFGIIQSVRRLYLWSIHGLTIYPAFQATNYICSHLVVSIINWSAHACLECVDSLIGQLTSGMRVVVAWTKPCGLFAFGVLDCGLMATLYYEYSCYATTCTQRHYSVEREMAPRRTAFRRGSETYLGVRLHLLLLQRYLSFLHSTLSTGTNCWSCE